STGVRYAHIRWSKAPAPMLVIRNPTFRRMRRESRNTPLKTGARNSSSRRIPTPTLLMMVKSELPNFLRAAPGNLSLGCSVTYSRQIGFETVARTAVVTFVGCRALLASLALLVAASACSSKHAPPLAMNPTKHVHTDAGVRDAGAQEKEPAVADAGSS